MRIHPINFLIAAGICALLTYGIMHIGASAMRMTIVLGTFVTLASTLALAIGVSFDNERTATNVKVIATCFFFGALLLNSLFAFAGFSDVAYLVSSGVFFLVFVLIANGLCAAKH